MTQALTQGPEQVGTGGECGGGGLPMPSAGMAFQSLGEAATGSPHFASERQKQGRGGALSPPPQGLWLLSANTRANLDFRPARGHASCPVITAPSLPASPRKRRRGLDPRGS